MSSTRARIAFVLTACVAAAVAYACGEPLGAPPSDTTGWLYV